MTKAELYYNRALIHRGNSHAIMSALQKAKRGEKVVIGTLGGSITYGANASDTPKTSYPQLIYSWWVRRFPHASIELVQTGIPATDSLYGVCRVQRDLLASRPDFVVVEYAVNDHEDNKLLPEIHESLIRRILLSEAHPGAVILENMRFDGTNCEPVHVPIAKYYDLTVLSYREAIWPEISSGNVKWDDVYGDMIHPNDAGHENLAALVCSYLDELLGEDVQAGAPAQIPAPLHQNRMEDARFLTGADVSSLGSWKSEWNGFLSDVPHGQPLLVECRAKFFAVRTKKHEEGQGAKGFYLLNGRKIPFDSEKDTGNWTGNWWPTTILIDSSSAEPIRFELHLESGRCELMDIMAAGFENGCTAGR